MYVIKLRKSDGRVVTSYVEATSAESAIERAERVLGGIARSCWPAEWLN